MPGRAGAGRGGEQGGGGGEGGGEGEGDGSGSGGERAGEGGAEGESGDLEAGAGGEDLAAEVVGRFAVADGEQARELRPLAEAGQGGRGDQQERVRRRGEGQGRRLQQCADADRGVRGEQVGAAGESGVRQERGHRRTGQQERAAARAAQCGLTQQRQAGGQHALARAGAQRDDGGPGQRRTLRQHPETRDEFGADGGPVVAGVGAGGQGPGRGQGHRDQAGRDQDRRARTERHRDRARERRAGESRHAVGHRVQGVRPGQPVTGSHPGQLGRPAAGQRRAEQPRRRGQQQHGRQRQAVQRQQDAEQPRGVQRQRDGQQTAGAAGPIEPDTEQRAAQRRSGRQRGQQRGRLARRTGHGETRQQQRRPRHLVTGPGSHGTRQATAEERTPDHPPDATSVTENWTRCVTSGRADRDGRHGHPRRAPAGVGRQRPDARTPSSKARRRQQGGP
ncbi:hypothetical protein KCH_10150 [Kitasatospora cheerisanensis KCTC 2395]|uniref:Uncharacterized protein n=1 Tax=Kitasatospora cheerisanensis KCTC 2395 TaxID=1348663 RepID=A0A066Z4U2_9ACTN|nr:hypothetical protein KCH_10150 [Kitasatospora cheerisanensis KCTC 2395]